MATKAAMVNGDDAPSPKKPALAKRQAQKSGPNVVDKTVGVWNEFRQFLSDVRGEMRKVVTPKRKEVEATTTVVIVAVFIFGLYFFVVDWIFGFGLDRLLKRLSGLPD
jgi:preprotein translocase subunit SecE